MRTVTEHIRQHLLNGVGIFEPPPKVNPDTQWSDQFEQLQ